MNKLRTIVRQCKKNIQVYKIQIGIGNKQLKTNAMHSARFHRRPSIATEAELIEATQTCISIISYLALTQNTHNILLFQCKIFAMKSLSYSLAGENPVSVSGCRWGRRQQLRVICYDDSCREERRWLVNVTFPATPSRYSDPIRRLGEIGIQLMIRMINVFHDTRCSLHWPATHIFIYVYYILKYYYKTSEFWMHPIKRDVGRYANTHSSSAPCWQPAAVCPIWILIRLFCPHYSVNHIILQWELFRWTT